MMVTTGAIAVINFQMIALELGLWQRRNPVQTCERRLA